jgi:hypothetical protein
LHSGFQRFIIPVTAQVVLLLGRMMMVVIIINIIIAIIIIIIAIFIVVAAAVYVKSENIGFLKLILMRFHCVSKSINLLAD